MTVRQASHRHPFSRIWSKALVGGHRKGTSIRKPRLRPQLEPLEDRLVPAVIDVTSPANTTGPGTLAAAINTANTNAQTSNTIDITVAGTYHIGQVGALAIFSNAKNTQSGLSLTIENTSGGAVAISGDNLTRVFDINPNDIIPANNVVLGAVTINGVTIENGLAQPGDALGGSGGGIRDQGPVDLTLNNDVLANNSATGDGGGICNAGNGTVNITSCTITNNFTTGSGGGFADQNNLGKLVVNNSLFLDNSAGSNGGGIQEGGPSTTITNSELKGNAAGSNGGTTPTGSGGALFANGNTLTITDSTLADNTATINGGGIELQTTGTVRITNATIVANTALNNAGGGIDDAATGFVALVNDTITNNFAVNGGGIFYAGTAGSTFSLQNTILALNTVSGVGPDANNAASMFTDLGGNLIGISGADSGNTGFTAGTTQTGTFGSPLNPMVAGLTNNGGPLAGAQGDQITVETEALLVDSLAIDEGVANGLPTDERGAPSSHLDNDVGAFHFEDAGLELNISASTPLSLGATQPVTVTVTNASGLPLPADNSTLTVTASSGLNIGGTQTFTLGPLPEFQGQSFTFNATGITLGTQTLTATVTSPDTIPATFILSATVNVIQPTTTTPITTTTTAPNTSAPTTTTITTPQGTLTLFAFGFGPTGIDLFEIDSASAVFAVPLMGGGAPIFLGTTLHLQFAELANGQILAELAGANGQNFLIDILDPFAPGVLGAVLGALHL